MPQKPPPKEKQFKPGQSGNPGGRPKSNLNKLLADFMATVPQGGTKSREQLFVEAIYGYAVKGNESLAREIWNRLEGKVKDQLEVEGAGMPRPRSEALKLLNKAQLLELLQKL